MAFAKVRKGKLIQYPYGLEELRADNPYTDFGSAPDVRRIFPTTEAATRDGEDLVDVAPTPPGNFDAETELPVEVMPVFREGLWFQAWVITKKPSPGPEEIHQRVKGFLAASDITLLRCVEGGVLVPEEWAQYRRALRGVLADPSQPIPERPSYPDGT